MGEPITIQFDTAHLSREIDRLTAEAEKRIAAAKANSDSQVFLDGVVKMAELVADGYRVEFQQWDTPYVIVSRWDVLKGDPIGGTRHRIEGATVPDLFCKLLERFK